MENYDESFSRQLAFQRCVPSQLTMAWSDLSLNVKDLDYIDEARFVGSLTQMLNAASIHDFLLIKD